MKIAICFWGKFTGRNNRNEIIGYEQSYEFLKKNILNYNTDIFFHGWDDNTNESTKLVELYKPKKYILEKQIIFDHPYKHYNFVPVGSWNTHDRINDTYSRFYSLKKAVELVDETYDLILISRFDTVFYKPIPFDMLTKENFYVSNWHLNQEGWGFNDGWFISNIKTMKEFSLIFDRLNDYFDIENGEYCKFLNKYGLTLESLPSGHAIHRFRTVEMNLQDKIYGIGLEYKTWGLIRRLNQNEDPWGYSGPNINIPNKL